MEKNTSSVQVNRRPPIVTIMGHVDHGKTSILDSIRKTNVQSREFGGITQHIGAYQVIHNNQKITFIDTPGHAAFSSMRSRGGKAADIVILVVAADDGVMPQTVEAISHAKNANVPIIVALNKIDKPGVDIQKIKQQLAQNNVLVEDWGGDVVCVELSAKTGQGISNLLDTILLVSEFLPLNFDPKGELEGIVIEARLDRQKGSLVSCIVKNGTLSVGDKIVASNYIAKVRSLMSDTGKMLTIAMPGDPVVILGFKEVPNVGDLVVQEGSELTELAISEDRVEIIGKDAKKTISVVLKADTQGTLEAVKASLAELVGSSVGSSYALKFLHSATGDISESDILLANSAKGLIIGFNVRLSASIEDFAKSQKVPVKSYKTIYELIDDAKDLLEGTAELEEKKIKGRAEVLKLFKLPSGDVIAGCKVLAGALKPDVRIAIYAKDPSEITSDDTPLYRGSIKKLKKGKDDTNVVGKDNECGVLLKPDFDALDKGMYIEVI